MVLPLGVAAQEEIVVLGLFPGKAMLQIDGISHSLAVGEGARGGVELLAADSESATVLVAGERRTLKLGEQISSHYAPAARKMVQIWPDRHGMYLVAGSINRHSLSFLVDTGATSLALNANEAGRLGIDYRKQGMRILGETASGRVWMYRLRLDAVSVGTIRLGDVEAVVIEGEYPSRVLLGQSFLNRVQMRRDGSLLQLEAVQ